MKNRIGFLVLALCMLAVVSSSAFADDPMERCEKMRMYEKMH